MSSKELGLQLYLLHHGIQGQEWGVRNGPPYPLDQKEHARVIKKAKKDMKRVAKKASKGKRDDNLNDEHVIPAGTKMYRITTNENESLEGHKYVSYLTDDRNYYKAFYGASQSSFKQEEYNGSYEIEYTLNEDLRIPSRKELQKIAVDLMKSDSDALREVAERYTLNYIEGPVLNSPEKYGKNFSEVKSDIQKWLKSSGSDITADDWYRQSVKSLSDRLKVEEDMSFAYGVLCSTYVKENGVRNKVFNAVKEKGYNAIMDEEDIMTRRSAAPMIILDGSETMNVTGKRKISEKEETKATNKWWKYAMQGKTGSWSEEQQPFLNV